MSLNILKLGVALFVLAAAATAQDAAIDVQRSTIIIKVSKAGLLSVAAHDHWISAPITSGTLGEIPAAHVAFNVDSAKMTVKADPKVDAKTQAAIQKDMEDMTLETSKFPAISFRSTHIEKQPDGQWKVDGDLSLHGVTRNVHLTVRRTGDFYAAHTVLKQTDFGIKPVSVAGGMIKVKNEVEIDFQIYPRTA